MLTGTINRILPHSLVDGPGNRTVVFLQGCSFHCLYCHNPYTIQYCNHCGECLDVCPAGALKQVNGKIIWNPTLCEECNLCEDICPHYSSPKTIELEPEQLMAVIEPTLSFISGVTISGGEPALQLEFISAFFKLFKEYTDLDTCIETNGVLDPAQVELLLPNLDYVLLDFKAWDPGIHKELTGRDNQPVKEVMQYLADKGILHEVRQVIVPGFTDTMENISSTARFIAGIDPAIPLRLLRFRPHGTRGKSATWFSPSTDLMDQLIKAAKKEGLIDVSRTI